jgi:hypothetical protein
MISGLIPGPQQPGNDIDTYFRPLVEDLKELWYNDKVQVRDEHKHEYFGLKAILFVTVSDSPVARNSCFLEINFPPVFFDISVHFITHLIKEIKLLGPVFLHQMYAYERFNGILKSFVRN